MILKPLKTNKQVMKAKSYRDNLKIPIGWKEWCAFPELSIPLIKAKIDTGAKTSSLHAFDIKYYRRNKKHFVRFTIHPVQSNVTISIRAHAPIIDYRSVMSSSGHKEKRYVITTILSLGDQSWPIELTLSNRDPLQYRLLLGREALCHRVLIDPADDFNLGKFTNQEVVDLYLKS